MERKMKVFSLEFELCFKKMIKMQEIHEILLVIFLVFWFLD